MASRSYIGVEPAVNPTECTVLSIIVYDNRPAPTFKVRYLERYPSDTPWPVLVSVVKEMRTELREATVVINNTFMGDPIKQMFLKEGITPHNIVISNTENAVITKVEGPVDPMVKFGGAIWKVPLKDIVSCMQAALQLEQLQISTELEYAQMLADEIMQYHAEISPSGKIERLRVDVNSDLLLSVALCVYTSSKLGGGTVPLEAALTEEGEVPALISDNVEMPVIFDRKTDNPSSGGIKYHWPQPNNGPINNRPGYFPGLQ